MQSDKLKVTPVYKEKPDIPKLGLALIEIAKELNKKDMEKNMKKLKNRKEDDMT